MIPKINLDISNSDKKGRVVVAMSGGVDSSVAAALAKLSGYETIGVTLQLYDSGSSPKKKGSCCAGQDIHDAKKVASSLEIPHYVLNYEEIFKKKVIDDFALSYERGETPIPCVLCNEKVKFDDLFKVAKDLEADALVTGHYISSQEGKMGREMYRAKDIDRDQSYFLFKTTREQLEFLRFPLGGFTKPEIRKIADELGLVVSQKPDSQDICFVPDGKYSNVLSKLKPEGYKKGRIVSKEGDFLGDHDGIVNFTIGQRRGLGLATGEPLYVIDIDPISLDVTVGSKEDLKKEILHLRDVNWIGDEDFINKSYKVKVKIGSTLNLEGANLISEGNSISVKLDSGIREGISPGQACVFYDDHNSSRVLGGGWIYDNRLS
ncbi:MAG: tRNA 2-thiouridine(34) synthase MnmA [Hyphomicrobiales bacterium]|jgi:tRNA-specific 2-thiouridylase|nr:tRNA 2-thiouridine(34) synthase MnmA [Alphaproteobacteria bacterium]MDG1153123.1 tRNA 2-thiouridine(34) synthase MnmA [Hyphomicrobiales bacterium]MBT4910882.1 tRNA 2-thiouridine(34) synthase MnmA [Alphaproteobacteria bacterium]MBT5663171.1 tRNA 2-thiouridine(34) synthase MnmA [Alphaproteobacteria bacterium]MDG1524407.1 tRNA 2-thiouridine(34) synthase MnmA [Hyphomicrobiales bacterium]|tara:strand:- start:114 stop:1244 length:1131 start_codon:yes stop_codon:yes gene_type:complete